MPQTKTRILYQPLKPGPSPCFANVLRHQTGVAERTVGGILSFLGRYASVLLLFSFKLQIGAQFALEIFLSRGPPAHHAIEHRAPDTHFSSPVTATSRLKSPPPIASTWIPPLPIASCRPRLDGNT